MKKTFIIAEAGVNHNGSLELAKQLIDAAVNSRADAVKFQAFSVERLVRHNAPKAQYQKREISAAESCYEMLKKLELDERAHKELVRYCHKQRIQFLSTPFDIESVDLLVKRLKLPRIKISSGEITNGPLLLKVAQTGKEIILSTGMSTLGEIEDALGVLAFGYMNTGAKPSIEAFRAAYCSDKGQQTLRGKVSLLHCTSEYPVPLREVNLRAITTLKSVFGLPVGLSDHTSGTVVAIAAVAMGAEIIEKHFTLDRSMPGPDHKASLEPDELKTLVQSIRQIEQAMGDGIKIPTPSELLNRDVVRKSLVAARHIYQGERFSKLNITCKRPGYGISPFSYWDWLGKISDRAYKKDEFIGRDDT